MSAFCKLEPLFSTVTLRGFPPKETKGSITRTPGGRTYWGGALFSLMTDIEIRKRAHDQAGLEDALRAVRNAGGVITEDWELRHVFEIADRAVGMSVLKQLYSKMKDKPVSLDLDKLWQQLGVTQKGITHPSHHEPPSVRYAGFF
jgi:hypothetical protein